MKQFLKQVYFQWKLLSQIQVIWIVTYVARAWYIVATNTTSHDLQWLKYFAKLLGH